MLMSVALAFLGACGGEESSSADGPPTPSQGSGPMQPAPGPGGTAFNPNAGGPAPGSGPPAGGGAQGGGPTGGEAPPDSRQAGQTNSGQPLPSGKGEATEAQVAASIQQHIRQETQAMGGVFKLHDPETESDLVLNFVEMKLPVNNVEGTGYFGYADFRVDGGDADQLYELGFWVRVDGGHVMVTRQRITREPVKDGEGWKQEVLYTNDAEWPDALK